MVAHCPWNPFARSSALSLPTPHQLSFLTNFCFSKWTRFLLPLGFCPWFPYAWSMDLFPSLLLTAVYCLGLSWGIICCEKSLLTSCSRQCRMVYWLWLLALTCPVSLFPLPLLCAVREDFACADPNSYCLSHRCSGNSISRWMNNMFISVGARS